MAATIPPATSLNDPNLMFTEDILADPSVAPQIFESSRTPNLRIYARGQGPGNPDIVTERTEAYILSWEETDPAAWE
ncbi:MAG: hypothetical protein H0T93_08120 [Chloroflexia bacterium]|jgi:hypothetical protein|nr:hypothetical protein [Chloroflexia bacterium]